MGKEVENMFFGEYDYATDIAVQREAMYEYLLIYSVNKSTAKFGGFPPFFVVD